MCVLKGGNSLNTGSVYVLFDNNEKRCNILSVGTPQTRQNFPLQGSIMRVQHGARQFREIMHFFSLSCMESTAFVSQFLWNEFMTRCRNQLFHVYDNVREGLGKIVVSVGFFHLYFSLSSMPNEVWIPQLIWNKPGPTTFTTILFG